MARTTHNEYSQAAQDLKVQNLRMAAHALAYGDPADEGTDRLTRLEAIVEWLAGRCGMQRQISTWEALRVKAVEMSGVNHGNPGGDVQTRVIGTLYGDLCKALWESENDPFKGLGF